MPRSDPRQRLQGGEAMPRPYKEENVSWGGFETRPYMRQFTPMNPASSPAVVIRDVSKSYMREERRLQVLTDCSFTIESNQFTVLLGPSGSGKTTLVRLIAGYERADAGEILCDGQPISRPGAERMVVFQETALFPWMTLLENVAYGPSRRAQSLPPRKPLLPTCCKKW